MYRLAHAFRRLRSLLFGVVALVASCGSMFQGPVSGRVVVARPADASDVIVQMKCRGPGFHGEVQTDQEQVRANASGRFTFLFSVQFPTTERCYLDALHPRYQTVRVALTDEAFQRVPEIRLTEWATLLSAGAPVDEAADPRAPWPNRPLVRFSTNLIRWLRSFPERTRPEFVRYVPDLHDQYRRALAVADRRGGGMQRFTKAVGRFEKETGFAYPFQEFHAVVESGDVSRVREFIDGGVLLEVWDGQRRTPLAAAAAEGHVDVLDLLLERSPGATRALVATGCQSPLLGAISNRHWGVVVELLRAGARPDAGCGNQLQVGDAMGELARRGDVDWLEAMIGAGAPVDLPSQQGATALAEAVRVGRIESVKMLLGAGANPTLDAEPGVSLLQVAVAKGYLDVEHALRRAGADA